MIFYTGVGSRKIPQAVAAKMMTYGIVFAGLGYTLRSGGAHGADAAFEKGCDKYGGEKEIFLPWYNFNNSNSPFFHVSEEAMKIAAEVYGKRWDDLSNGAKLLMGRNIYQVLGISLDTPSKFLLCWTPDGAETAKKRSRETGGTGQAIACASLYNIPVFNLQKPMTEDLLLDFLGELNDC